jgi:CRP-like cAMP-binding protein
VRFVFNGQTVSGDIQVRVDVHTHENQLVASLPRADRLRLLAQCEPVHLVLAQVLCEIGQATRHAYFPTDSFVSLIAQLNPQHGLEVGMAGNEGMLGWQLALGVAREPVKALVQGAGLAWRVDARAFRRELARSPPLQHRVHRYVSVLMDQRAVAAACLRFHEIGPRLSRWLLMSQDRAHADQFPVTQEALAAMLGVRRVGVTAAAGALQRLGLIEYHRGQVWVLNRRGLEAASCSCYAADQKAYALTMNTRR